MGETWKKLHGKNRHAVVRYAVHGLRQVVMNRTMRQKKFVPVYDAEAAVVLS